MFLKTLQYSSVIAGGLLLGLSVLFGLIWLTEKFARWLFPGDLWDPFGILTLLAIWTTLPIGFGFGYLWAKDTRHHWDKPTNNDSDRGV